MLLFKNYYQLENATFKKAETILSLGRGEALGEFNDQTAAIEAICELVHPTGVLTEDICAEIIQCHFMNNTKRLMADLFNH